MDAIPAPGGAGSLLGRTTHPQSLHFAEELAPIDKQLIHALQVDGRRSYASISRELGLPERVVRGRVRELRTAGIVDIITVVDPELLGYRSMALAGVRTTAERPLGAVAAEIAELGAVNYVALTAGRYNILAELACRDFNELLTTIDAGVAGVAGVATVESHPFLRLYYQEPEWQAAQGKDQGTTRHVDEVTLDSTDLEILRRLNHDGRAPYSQIAEELSVSESAVRQRVNRLRDSGTLRIMAIANPTSLGFSKSAWLCISVAPGTPITKVAEELIDVPSITYLAVCGGRFDIFAEAVCRDNNDLLRVLDNDVRQMPGISRVEASVSIGMSYKRLPPAGEAAVRTR